MHGGGIVAGPERSLLVELMCLLDLRHVDVESHSQRPARPARRKCIDQRALIAAQISEVNASTTYARARVSLDQVLGETLEKNNISLDDALRAK